MANRLTCFAMKMCVEPCPWEWLSRDINITSRMAALKVESPMAGVPLMMHHAGLMSTAMSAAMPTLPMQFVEEISGQVGTITAHMVSMKTVHRAAIARSIWPHQSVTLHKVTL